MKRIEQTYEGLIENTSFNDWVLSDRVVDNDDWEQQLEETPEMVEDAANLIQTFQFKKKSLPTADIDGAWSMLDENISAPKKLSRRVWIRRIAAAVLVFATATTFWFTSTKKTKTIGQSTDFGEQLNVNLPDKSMAQLSANTKLKFKEEWDLSKKREVSLDGQAFFDVETTKDKATFTVNTEHFKVEVLGTQFDVIARESMSSVAVKEGEVRVKFPVNSEVVEGEKISRKAKVNLLPGDKLTFKNNKFFITKVGVNRVKAHQVMLEDVNRVNLSNIFKDIYGYELEFDVSSNEIEKLAGYNFLTENSLKVNLDLLIKPFDLKYEIKDKRIIISK